MHTLKVLHIMHRYFIARPSFIKSETYGTKYKKQYLYFLDGGGVWNHYTEKVPVDLFVSSLLSIHYLSKKDSQNLYVWCLRLFYKGCGTLSIVMVPTTKGPKYNRTQMCWPGCQVLARTSHLRRLGRDIKVKQFSQESADKRMDGRYQVDYLPALWSIITLHD